MSTHLRRSLRKGIFSENQRDQILFKIVEQLDSFQVWLNSLERRAAQQKVINSQIITGKNNLIDDSKAPQGAPIVTREEDEIQIEDSDVTQAARSEELMHPAAVPELIMPLKVMILQPEISDVVPTKSPTAFVPIIIKEVANGESKDDLVLGKEAKNRRIEVENIEESLMKIDLDEFKFDFYAN
ncbi:hypothetical protein TEA_022507 [Camellia sinensis var. sinensis]|uniref:Uncharacterized protein n=1 Tax=Camellia sinensis var. sinensis TaxID=542762 RepID=A0A4S4EPN1_CAMSN|nr:hypothetical protein TEA_022507 [Camellia sinensis var. sinensis]